MADAVHPEALQESIVYDDGQDSIATLVDRLGIGNVRGVLFLVAGSAALDGLLLAEIQALVDKAIRPVVERDGFLVDGATPEGATGLLASGAAGLPRQPPWRRPTLKDRVGRGRVV